MLFKA